MPAVCNAYFSGYFLLMENSFVYFLSETEESAVCDRKQAFRFMGCRDDSVNEELDRLYDECVALVKKQADLRALWRKSELRFSRDDEVEFDFGKIRSASLFKNLYGCREAYVFVATAGIGIDRLLLRYRRTDPAKAMVLSAVGSSVIECWCDRVNEYLSAGIRTRPRFSPGYGGVELEHQRAVLDFVEAEKRLGITLNDSYFMVPVKSVTAFVGIVEE